MDSKTYIFGLLLILSPGVITLLDGFLWGNHKKLIDAIQTNPAEFYAKELHDAMWGFGTNENALIDILCFLSNKQIEEVKKVYATEYGESLAEAMSDDNSGDFGNLLTSLCDAKREENGAISKEDAIQEARKLAEAAENEDAAVFISMFTQKSEEQLMEIFSKYWLSGRKYNLMKDIKKQFSGDFQKGLLAIVDRVVDKSIYFADRLYETVDGYGTNDDDLIRIMVTQFNGTAEEYKMKIKKRFEDKYGSLVGYIKDDTSGDFEAALLKLVR